MTPDRLKLVDTNQSPIMAAQIGETAVPQLVKPGFIDLSHEVQPGQRVTDTPSNRSEINSTLHANDVPEIPDSVRRQIAA